MASSSITLITTGGTIGSSSESESVNVTQGQKQLDKHIQDVCQHNNIRLKPRAAFNKNSEDLTPVDWLTLINAVAEEIESGCEKIIITHGTDTMAYTAAAIALCFRKRPVKIVLTGSCFTLDHPESDVTANLLGAFAAISETKITNGVYVSFLNSKKEIQVTEALSLKPMIFDELAFCAVFNEPFGVLDTEEYSFRAATHLPPSRPLDITIDPANIAATPLQTSEIGAVQLSCYPGMNAVQLCAGLPAGCSVIISLYHSGTGPSQQETNSLMDAIHSRPDLTFLLTPLPSRYIAKPYTATITLIRAGARLFQDIQPHVLYVFIIMGLSSGRTLEEVLTELTPHQLPVPTP